MAHEVFLVEFDSGKNYILLLNEHNFVFRMQKIWVGIIPQHYHLGSFSYGDMKARDACWIADAICAILCLIVSPVIIRVNQNRSEFPVNSLLHIKKTPTSGQVFCQCSWKLA